jgi:polysaccharide deacetylase family protein (PEP-CTERM system associated)
MITNALTIDVEDRDTPIWARFCGSDTTCWGNPNQSVVPNTRKALEILHRHGQKATFFVLGRVAEYYPELVKEICQGGHEVATHGYSHRLVYQMDRKEFEQDLLKSIDLIQNITNIKVIGYRAGFFSITEDSLWALDLLLKNDIRYDSSIFPIRRKLYGIPSASTTPSIVRNQGNRQLWEFPPSTIRLLGQNLPIAGGGYFRVLPYRFIQRCITKINSQGHPAVVYLHPHEVVAERVRADNLPKGLGVRFDVFAFTQGINLATFPGKLERLFDDFKFGSVKQVFNL